MGRKKNNPDLVQELIDERWSMDQDEFEEKYSSLNSDDMAEVSAAIYGMEEEFMNDDFDED